jgi:hypothetical protein
MLLLVAIAVTMAAPLACQESLLELAQWFSGKCSVTARLKAARPARYSTTAAWRRLSVCHVRTPADTS